MRPAPRVKGGTPERSRRKQSNQEKGRSGEEVAGKTENAGRRRRGQEELRASGAGLQSGFIIYRILIAGNRLQLETL